MEIPLIAINYIFVCRESLIYLANLRLMLLEIAKLTFDIQTENHSFNSNDKTELRFYLSS